jgi:transcriptional regulator with XRE-family HTH domain
VSQLSEALSKRVETEGLRPFAKRLGIAHTTLDSLARNARTSAPEIETLQRIAAGLELPLWRVVEMAGINLELPQSDDDRVRRLVGMARRHPALQALVDHLIELAPNRPEFVDGMLGYLEYEAAKLDAIDRG